MKAFGTFKGTPTRKKIKN